MATSKQVVITAVKILLALVLSTPVALFLLALETTPSVPAQEQLNEADIARVERLLLDSAPSDVRSFALQHLSLTNEELNLLLRYATELLDTGPDLKGRILLPSSTLRTEASLPVDSPFMQVYVNLGAEFVSRGKQLELISLSIGHIRVPGRLVNELASRFEAVFLQDNQTYFELTELLDSVQQIDIAENRLEVDLMWEPTLLGRVRDQARQFLISTEDQQRIARHYRNLASVVDAFPQSTRAIPLSSLLKPLFASAGEVSDAGGDPVAENRTLLLTLATYVNQDDIGQYLDAPLEEQLPEARTIEVRIQRRQDLAQHVTSTAAIAASAGVGLAQIISSLKESYDARYRTGYSFSDLTANTAGVAIGKIATDSQASAKTLQQRMGELIDDGDYLPPVDPGADGLSETDFNAIYRDNTSDEYQARLQEIETLVYQRPLFEGLLPVQEN